VLHPGAASQSRRWPADRWAEVARLLGRRADVRVTGSAGERPLCTQIARAAGLGDDSVVAGDLDLPELMALVANAQLLVCGDTGVAHVATATGTPSVLLFGPTSPRLWGPAIDRDRHACLWHGVGNGDPHAEQTDPALLDITSVEVLAAAVALLDRDRGVA
jgi:ADP-heptose:LPS heptosyltransferase